MANPTGRGGFKTGKSGNPGGRPRQLASVMHEARRHTFEAKCDDIWQQRGESFEAFEMRVKAAADAARASPSALN